MSAANRLIIALFVLISSFLAGTTFGEDWAEVLRVDLEPGWGRSAIPTDKGWSLILEPQGERWLIFASWLLREGGRLDEVRLMVETADGERHAADVGATSAGSGGDGVVGSVMCMSPAELKRDDIRAVIVEHLTAEGIARAEARRKAAEEAVEEARKNCPLPQPKVGQPFPFSLTSIDGGKLDSEALKGRVVVFDFWASWCAPCVKEIPELIELYRQYEDRGLQIIGINFDDDEAMLRSAAKKLEIPWPQVLVGDQTQRQAWSKQLDLGSIPRYFVIDRQGILRTDHGRGKLNTLVPELLNER